MFENIGRKIKIFARLFLGIFAIVSVIWGWRMLDIYEEGIYVLYALGGVFVALLISFMLYGFGELIEKVTYIEQNTRTAPISETAREELKIKIEELESLRKNNLITEEEYRNKYQNIKI